MPWWGWVLIVLAILVVLTIITRGHIWRFMADILEGLADIIGAILR